MLKFDFSVRTREGQRISSIMIMGKDRADAERKLYQMYRHCEILRCDIREPGARHRPVALRVCEEALPVFAKES